jgi:CDP-diglyceride synthetase
MNTFLGFVGGIVLGIVLAWIVGFDFNERGAVALLMTVLILIMGIYGAVVGHMFENS